MSFLPNDPVSRPFGADVCGAAATYTILLRDFTATVSIAGRSGRPTVHISLELKVSHPGLSFPDDITAVMSYEDIVEDLRRLCAQEAVPGPDYLADQAAALCLAHPKVRQVRVDVELPSLLPDTAGAGVTITRNRDADN
ncbi:dihydroneopterin aldolase (plasmid) [Azospirillum argentinense]|uniref:Dihydroneopterin aldolase n=1 Tax=Azospirillum brasilense TaxID=192 RepID=A0A4D8Q6W5_AZOBR|nr:dihydroneopterin aldolase [Azospirillum argentinense]